MTSLKGILYPSGHIDFLRRDNEWAFARMKSLRSDQMNRIVMHPEVAPLEVNRASDVDPGETSWLEGLTEIINACSTVNLQLKDSTLRLRQAVEDINETTKLVVLASQEAINDFADAHWQRIAYFYAYRHDGFRFDLGTVISTREHEARRDRRMDLVTRAVGVDDEPVPKITFDATGPHADVHIVEWRGNVREGESGLFKDDEIEVGITMPHARRPVVFLYEKRPEFKNHAYVFSGDKLEKHLKRLLKKARLRSTPELD